MLEDLALSGKEKAQFNLAEDMVYFEDYGIKTKLTDNGIRLTKDNTALYFNITKNKTDDAPRTTNKNNIYTMNVNTKDTSAFMKFKDFVFDIFSSNYKTKEKFVKQPKTKSYSDQDKLKYYRSRINDKSLSANQREYAQLRYKTIKKKVGN